MKAAEGRVVYLVRNVSSELSALILRLNGEEGVGLGGEGLVECFRGDVPLSEGSL